MLSPCRCARKRTLNFSGSRMYSFHIAERTVSEIGVGGLNVGFRGNGYTNTYHPVSNARASRDQSNGLNYFAAPEPVVRPVGFLVLHALRAQPERVAGALLEGVGAVGAGGVVPARGDGREP